MILVHQCNINGFDTTPAATSLLYVHFETIKPIGISGRLKFQISVRFIFKTTQLEK